VECRGLYKSFLLRGLAIKFRQRGWNMFVKLRGMVSIVVAFEIYFLLFIEGRN